MLFLSQLTENPVLAIAFLLAIVVAITVHEFAHAWTAWKLGDDTAYLLGRVTLDPRSHLDPVGSILFLLIGFGWGRPVPYNPMRLRRKIDELWIALAGPASNLVIAACALLLGRTGLFSEDIISTIFGVNVVLAAFNMLPIPPLDGSALVDQFVPGYKERLAYMGIFIVLALSFLPGSNGDSLLGTVMEPLLQGAAWIANLGGLL